jgi:hypothetical protein
MEFKIEKGVPMMPLRTNAMKYPWPMMEPGDSVFFMEKLGSAATAANRWGKENGRKFVSRKQGQGVRIWRVE